MIFTDTTFLIDLQRSSRNPRHQSAARWLKNHSEVEIVLSAIVLGEFAEGFETTGHPVIEHYRAAHRIIGVDDRVAVVYSRISRDLRSKGTPIGANDTWIAATALAHLAPLLTRNVVHFNRIEGLEVMGY
jgi:tRNA(fMet)-specific endonuclease VapC